MKRKAMALIFAALACVCVWLGVNATQNAALAWGLAAVLVLLTARIWMGNKRPERKKPVQQDMPAYSFVSFHLKGVTFPNDEGIDRQELLHRIDKQLPPFEDGGALDVKLKPVKFRGEDAVECRVNGNQIGYVPKEKVADVLAAMKKPDATISDFHVVGGSNGLNYGVSIAVRFRNEKGGTER